jgi:hypothetical protein
VWARLAMMIARYLWEGLIRTGTSMSPIALPPADPPRDPPPGHPERLIPEVPPTPEERRLWDELG